MTSSDQAFSFPSPSGEPAKRVPRALDPIERRVLGALLEKEQATPDHYPLSLNALFAACNQKSNREPVMALTEAEVQGALDRLLADVLVWRSDSGRVRKWSHNVERRWHTGPEGKALLTLLLLRGPQTPGELRGRSGRLHEFADVSEVHEALAVLAGGKEPLAAELPRQPGQKESRWTDLLSGEPEGGTAPSQPPAPAQPGPTRGLADRVVELEERVRELERRLDEWES